MILLELPLRVIAKNYTFCPPGPAKKKGYNFGGDRPATGCRVFFELKDSL